MRNHSRANIIAAARKQDKDIGDNAMIAEGEWGYWVGGSIYVTNEAVEKSSQDQRQKPERNEMRLIGITLRACCLNCRHINKDELNALPIDTGHYTYRGKTLFLIFVQKRGFERAVVKSSCPVRVMCKTLFGEQHRSH